MTWHKTLERWLLGGLIEDPLPWNRANVVLTPKSDMPAPQLDPETDCCCTYVLGQDGQVQIIDVDIRESPGWLRVDSTTWSDDEWRDLVASNPPKPVPIRFHAPPDTTVMENFLARFGRR